MTLLVPLTPVPSQTLSITLGEQRCRLNVYQKAFGIFVDVYVNDEAVVVGAVARNLAYIVRSAYLGFVGDLYFNDTNGTSDPSYEGLGSRFVLLYDEG
jgi:hypothetical protein